MLGTMQLACRAAQDTVHQQVQGEAFLCRPRPLASLRCQEDELFLLHTLCKLLIINGLYQIQGALGVSMVGKFKIEEMWFFMRMSVFCLTLHGEFCILLNANR